MPRGSVAPESAWRAQTLQFGMSPQGASGPASRLVRAAVVVTAVMHSLAACQRTADAARIVVHPLPWASHTFGMAKLAAELSRRGHQVRLRHH